MSKKPTLGSHRTTFRALPLLKRKAAAAARACEGGANRLLPARRRDKSYSPRPMSLASRAWSRGAPIRRIGEAGHRTGWRWRPHMAGTSTKSERSGTN